MSIILRTENLVIGYEKGKTRHCVAKDVNVNLCKGELVCLLGPNGAGKSTLMRTISGSQKPLNGKVFLENVNIHTIKSRDLAKKLSLVLTERVQAGLLTAYEVVALGRYPHTNWSGKMSEEDHEIVQRSIEVSGANDLAGRLLGELSDGERQKVMVARALAQETEIMILDEITAFLDLPRRVEILQLLRKLARKTNKAILLSTHDMDLALRNADQLWLLPKNGDLQVGSPEDLVLNGQFEDTFTSEGISFNKETGAFQTEHHYVQQVELNGEGPAAIWTRRALERAAIGISTNAPVQIKIESNGKQTSWHLLDSNQRTTFNTIYELLLGIQKR